MALTKITSDGITDGTITGTDLATNIDLVDNQRLRLGTGNDLEIFHNNDNSFINDSGTGQLMIQASGLRLRNYPEGHTQVNCQDDVVELYYNNSKKLETDTNGITVTGNVDAGSYSFLLNDSGRIRLGTSQDFEIYHDGSNSLIKDAGTGALVLSTNQLLVRNAAVNEFLIQAVENAGVKLYYDNSKKFETLTDGVLVTGKVAATGDLALTSSDGQKIRIGQSNDLQIYHDGTNNYIEGNNQKTIIRNTSNNIHLQAVSGEAGIDVIPNSSVRLYFDGSKKFETVTAGISVTGQVSADNLHIGDGSTGIKVGDSDDLQIYHTGTVSRIQDEGTGGLEITSNGTGVDINKGLSEYMARFLTDGAVMLYHNNLLKFQTTSDGCQLQSNTTDAVFSLRSTAQDGAPVLQFLSDDFDDTADAWRLRADGGGTAFGIQNYASGSWENNIVCQEQGAVKLYYDNVLKAFTYSDGLHIDTGILRGDDNAKIVLGDSSDLQIYHNGTVSFIQDAGTGGIAVITNDFAVNNAADTEQMIRAIEDQGVFLFYNGSIKFQTLNGGVQVDGNLAFGANNCQIQTGSSGHMVAIQGGATNMGGRIEFRGGNSSGDIRMYAQGATSTQVERMRIKPDGQVLFNTTSSIGSGVLNIDIGGVSSAAILDVGARIQSHENGNHAFHFQNTSGTTVGKVIINSGSTTYSTSSDYRVKENVLAISDGITRLKTLKPYRFNFINDKSTTVDGFFAHEVTAVPEAIDGTKDETQDILYTEEDTIPPGKEVGDVKETIPVYQGIDQSKLVPLLVAALQEAITKIEVIQTEVAALKAS